MTEESLRFEPINWQNLVVGGHKIGIPRTVNVVLTEGNLVHIVERHILPTMVRGVVGGAARLCNSP